MNFLFLREIVTNCYWFHDIKRHKETFYFINLDSSGFLTEHWLIHVCFPSQILFAILPVSIKSIDCDWDSPEIQLPSGNPITPKWIACCCLASYIHSQKISSQFKIENKLIRIDFWFPISFSHFADSLKADWVNLSKRKDSFILLINILLMNLRLFERLFS